MARTDNQQTPEYLFKPLEDFFHFTLDAAANHINRVVANYIDAEADGLKVKWDRESRVWCNPPISLCHKFSKKAADSGCLVVMLLPARVDAKWFRENVTTRAHHLILLDKRVRWFGGEYAWETYCIAIYRHNKPIPDRIKDLGLHITLPSAGLGAP